MSGVDEEYDENRQRILKGLRALVAGDEEISRIELVNTSGARDEFVWGGDYEGDLDPDLLATEAMDEAHSDAKSMGGEQKYAVRIYVADNKKRAKKQIRFTAFERSQSWLLEGSTQQPGSVAALLEQTQRHTEVAVSTMVKGTQGLLVHLQKENERLSRDNERLQSKHMEMLQLFEELSSSKHERELDLMRERNSEERKGEIVDMVRIHLPRIFGKAGRYLRGENPNEDDGISLEDIETITEIIRQLKPDQMPKLLSAFRPDQAGAILEIVKKVAAAEEKKPNGKKKALTPGS